MLLNDKDNLLALNYHRLNTPMHPWTIKNVLFRSHVQAYSHMCSLAHM